MAGGGVLMERDGSERNTVGVLGCIRSPGGGEATEDGALN